MAGDINTEPGPTTSCTKIQARAKLGRSQVRSLQVEASHNQETDAAAQARNQQQCRDLDICKENPLHILLQNADKIP